MQLMGRQMNLRVHCEIVGQPGSPRFLSADDEKIRFGHGSGVAFENPAMHLQGIPLSHCHVKTFQRRIVV